MKKMKLRSLSNNGITLNMANATPETENQEFKQ